MALAEWTLSANGNGDAYVNTATLPIKIDAYGTFDGGTVTVEFSPDGGTTWIAITDVSFTENGTAIIRHVPGQPLRPVLAGATSPSLTVVANECVTE